MLLATATPRSRRKWRRVRMSSVGSNCAHSGATEMKRARNPMKKQAALAIAIGMAFAVTPPAHADNDWIALAISDSTGQLKFTSGAASQDAAQQTVMDACRKTI